MWIETRTRKKGTIYKAHIKKVDGTTGEEFKLTKSFPKRSDATAWARHIESDLERGRYNDTRQVDSEQLSEYIALYISHITPADGEPPSKIGWQQEVARLNAWSRHAFAKRAISKIGVPDLLDYIKKRRSSKSRRSKGDEIKLVSDATIRQELMALSNVYRFAAEHCGLAITNPVKLLPKSARPAPSRHIDVRITKSDWERLKPLLEARRNPIYVLAAELAIETALRQGELLRLCRADVHLGKPAHIIARDNVQSGGRIVENSRAVPLSSRAAALVRQLLKSIPPDQQELFASVSADGLSRAFREDCASAGILDSHGEPATFHSTRHEAISRMAARIPINILQKITGHKTMSQLQRYYNPTVADLAQHFLRKKRVNSTR